MVKKRRGTLGGSARVKNLSTRKRLEMHGVHPLAIQICTVPIVGHLFEKCTGLEDYTRDFPCGDPRSDSDKNTLPQRVNSILGNMGSVGDFGKMLVMNMSSHQPNHIRINKLLNKERAQGNYEPYYALKSIHVDRVNEFTFVSELKVSG